ncbi:hypothetical protein SAMN05421812_105245 [Asanoa hainanensis]|uniref:Uncharacterized protein n=1 Tax=Asanoa hainanensis TaxID=560556 RepID=A0A239M8Z0_9ACTN|nr:hypothetical protein [Asanoa hainanensis]SNT39175.1 hypothetical protein SAMN05421812_105245 [Asanoa hainanensis]
MELLGELVGYRRIVAEPDAVAELASACANLPLALRIAGAGLVDQPRRGIADYVAELAARNSIVALTVDGDEDSSVRSAFDLSYRALPESAQLIPGRYTAHDLLRQYAAHLAIDEDSLPTRTSAVHRLFDWFSSMSVMASRLLHPEVLRLPVREELPTAVPALTGAGPRPRQDFGIPGEPC